MSSSVFSVRSRCLCGYVTRGSFTTETQRSHRDTDLSWPFAGFLQLLDLAHHQLALQRRDAIWVQNAIAVIGFMQQASSFQLNSFNLVFFAVEVVAARDYAHAARHL